MEPKHPIDRAADAVDGAVKLAAILGVTAQAISNWKSDRGVPIDRCVAIEVACDGAVRRWDLRPADWFKHWPELIGTEGAPKVPAKAPAVKPGAERAAANGKPRKPRNPDRSNGHKER
jgi:DNA-binding transcriptional regulator YdaS (Cro superfamily)